MKPTPGVLRRWTVLVGIAILAMWTGPAAMAAGQRDLPLRVVGLTVGGSGVEITVSNPAPERRQVTVVVRALLGDRMADIPVSVVIPGGQKALIVVPPPAPGRRFTPLSVILDDGTPF